MSGAAPRRARLAALLLLTVLAAGAARAADDAAMERSENDWACGPRADGKLCQDPNACCAKGVRRSAVAPCLLAAGPCRTLPRLVTSLLMEHHPYPSPHDAGHLRLL